MKTYPIRYGIWGSGHIAERHIRSLKDSPNSVVVGIFSNDKKRAKYLSEKYGIKNFNSPEELVKAKDIDVIDICNANYSHYYSAKLAIKNGKHVIVEKPLAIKIKQVKELVRLADAHNIICCCVFQKRFNKSYEFVLRKIKPRIKDVCYIEMMVHLPRSAEYYKQPRKSSAKLAGGGVIINQAIHDIDLIVSLLGRRKKIVASNFNLYHDIEVEDTSISLSELKHGALFLLDASTAPLYKKTVLTTILCKNEIVIFDNYRADVYDIKFLGIKDFLWKLPSFLNKILGIFWRLESHRFRERGSYSDIVSNVNAKLIDKRVELRCEGKTTIDTHKFVVDLYRKARK